MNESQDVTSPPVRLRPALSVQEKVNLILEGLARKRPVTEIAQEMGVSRQAFYAMGHQVRGLLYRAFLPKKRGRKKREPDPEKEAMQRQIERLWKENVHLTTLWRVAQRAIRYRVALDNVKKTAMGARGTRRRLRR